MSGAEAITAVQLIDACLGITHTIIAIGRAVHDAQGLPPKLRELLEQLPAIQELLDNAHDRCEEEAIADDARKSAQPILRQCEAALAELRDIFRKACPADGENRSKRIWRGAKTVFFGRNSQVQKLLVTIQDNLRLLEQKEIYVIGDKLDALQQVTEALADGEDGKYAHTGAGNIVANEGGNPTNYITGGSNNRQINNPGVYNEGPSMSNQGSFSRCTFSINRISEVELSNLIRSCLPEDRDAAHNDQLFRCVSQLSYLSREGDHRIVSQSSDDITKNISDVLSAAVRTSILKQREQDGVGDMAEIRRILAVSKEVVVNKRGRRLYAALPSHSMITEVTRATEEHPTSQCVVQVCTWRRKIQRRKSRYSFTDTIARVDIYPILDGDTDSKACISVYLMQRETFQRGVCQNYTTLPTRIIARTMIHDSSPIFTWIQIGDISRVIDALEKAEVSLWSCDTNGTSLISHAVFAQQPELCKYLIEHGADVNCIEPSLLHFSSRRVPLLLQVGHKNYRDIYGIAGGKTPRDRHMECLKLLLQNDADPTVGGSDSALLFNFQNRISAPFEILNLIFAPGTNVLLQHGSHYINCMERDNERRTLLLQYCNNPAVCIRLFGIDFLLTEGSDIRERDMKDDTCLHLVLQVDTIQHYDCKEYLFALVYLIYKGADITAVNKAGFTPLDLVQNSPLKIESIPIDAWWRYILTKCKLFTINNQEEEDKKEEEEEEEEKEEEEEEEEEEEKEEEKEWEEEREEEWEEEWEGEWKELECGKKYSCECCYSCMIQQHLHDNSIHLEIFISALKTHGDLWMSVKAVEARPNVKGRYKGAACIHHVKRWPEDQTSQGQGTGVVSTEIDDLALDFSNLSLAD